MTIHTIHYSDQMDYEIILDVSGNLTLAELAGLFLESISFDPDHAFGFYSNIRNPYQSKTKYTLFADLEDSEDNDPGVETTLVGDVFAEDKTFLFLFDYGDEWRFPLECTFVKTVKSKRKVRKVAMERGYPPEQYPDVEE